MISAEKTQSELSNQENALIRIPIAEFWAALVQRRFRLAALAGAGALISLGVSFLLPNQYTSTVELMPPDQATFTNQSLLNTLEGPPGISAMGNNLVSMQRTPGAVAIGVLSSRTVQDDLINQFNLRSVYHAKFYEDARKRLTRKTKFEEDKKSGIISIAVTDMDKYRARDIAQGYVADLNRLISSLSSSSARREKDFLDQRLKLLKLDLDASSVALSQFSSNNASFNPDWQGQVTMESAANLQGQLILAEAALSELKAKYADENIQVRVAKARVEKLQAALRKLSGDGEEKTSDRRESDDTLPSIRKLPILGVRYYDLSRQVSLDASLYETLTKQYELARVEEAKDIPQIKVLDAPEVPERKSFPHGSIFLLFGMLISLLGGVTWILAPMIWKLACRNDL